MNAVPDQLAEEQLFDIRLHDAAGKVDDGGILKAYDGAVGPGGEWLSHQCFHMIDVPGKLWGDVHKPQVRKSGRGLFVLYPDVKLPDKDILDEKRNKTDQRVVPDVGICGDVRI